MGNACSIIHCGVVHAGSCSQLHIAANAGPWVHSHTGCPQAYSCRHSTVFPSAVLHACLYQGQSQSHMGSNFAQSAFSLALEPAQIGLVTASVLPSLDQGT